MEANGRLERSNNKCLWPECVVEAAARDFRHWSLANGRLERPNNTGLWRQTAGCKALTTNACRQSASPKLPPGILGIWRLANGRLERSNNKCLWPECLVEAAARDFTGLKAGKRQAWTQRAMQANGRLERPNKHFRGLKAGKRQAWTPAMECLVQAAAERCKGLKASRQKQVPYLRCPCLGDGRGRGIYYTYVHTYPHELKKLELDFVLGYGTWPICRPFEGIHHGPTLNLFWHEPATKKVATTMRTLTHVEPVVGMWFLGSSCIQGHLANCWVCLVTFHPRTAPWAGAKYVIRCYKSYGVISSKAADIVVHQQVNKIKWH